MVGISAIRTEVHSHQAKWSQEQCEALFMLSISWKVRCEAETNPGKNITTAKKTFISQQRDQNFGSGLTATTSANLSMKPTCNYLSSAFISHQRPSHE